MKHIRNLSLAIVPISFILAVCVAPTLRLVIEAWAALDPQSDLTQARPWQTIKTLLLDLASDAYIQQLFAHSLEQTALTLCAVLLFGTPIAWVFARYEFMGRSTMMQGLMLPFVTPTLVAAMGILALFSTANTSLDDSVPWFSSPLFLLLYGNVFFNLCLVIRAAHEGFTQVDAKIIEAARTLGASSGRVFWRIELLLAYPYVLSALCLVCVYSFSSFGLVLVLGGQNQRTLAVEIYTLIAHELKLPDAAVLALLSLSITASIALVYAVYERRLAFPKYGNSLSTKPARTVAQRLIVLVTVCVLLGLCAAPVWLIMYQAIDASVLNPQAAWDILSADETLLATWNTLRFSAISTLCAMVLAVLHALAAKRSIVLRAFNFLPMAISPIAIGLGLLLLYPNWIASLPLLIAAYTLLAYPLIAQALAAGLDAIPMPLMHAAHSLGASPWRCFWRITWPLLLPALRRGAALAVASSMGEFAVSLMLSRPEWLTLSTLIYQHLGKVGAYHREAAILLSAYLLAIALLSFILVSMNTRTKTKTNNINTQLILN